MGLFSKKPKSSASETAAGPAGLPNPPTTSQTPSTTASAAKPAKGKRYSVDSADFLALRSEMMDLRARLDASEQAKVLVETRLAALDATTAAMSTERPGSNDLRTQLTDLQAQLEVVAETAATAHANAENAAAKAAAAATVATNVANNTTESPPSTATEGPDPALVARIDALAAHLETVSSVSPPDPVIATRLDALSERVGLFDSLSSQLAQLNARVSAQAEFGVQLGSLRDRISELSSETEDRRAAAFAATGDADLRDRVNAIADRVGANEGVPAQIALLAERVAANDTSTRLATEQVAAIEQRLNSVSTELANQVNELGRDIDGLAAHSNELAGGTVSGEVIDSLKTAQVKLAAEQARYEIAFRQDLAALAEQVRRGA